MRMVARPSRRVAVATVLTSAALIAAATLGPTAPNPGLPAACIICGTLGGVDLILNIVLFLPLGMGLRWLTGSWKVTALAGLMTTVFIESLQWQLIPGRDASLGDILANTAGTLLGAWLGAAGPGWLTRSGAAARRPGAAAGVLAAMTIAISGWALRPAPPSQRTQVQWAPIRPNTVPFLGRLQALVINGVATRTLQRVPAGWVAVVDFPLEVRVEVTGITPVAGRAIVTRSANAVEEGYYLGQWGDVLVFRTSTNASRMRLRSPLFGLQRAFDSTVTGDAGAGGSTTMVASASDTEVRMARVAGGDRLEVSIPRTAGLAWSLLLPWEVVLGSRWWWANAAFLGAVLAPAAFFGARASAGEPPDETGAWRAWWPLALAIATLALAPLVAGIAASTWLEWTGVVAGIGTGIVVARLTPTARALKADDAVGTFPP